LGAFSQRPPEEVAGILYSKKVIQKAAQYKESEIKSFVELVTIRRLRLNLKEQREDRTNIIASEGDTKGDLRCSYKKVRNREAYVNSKINIM
jgi:hypothetical protein